MRGTFESVVIFSGFLLVIIALAVPGMSQRGQQLMGWLTTAALIGLVIGAIGWVAATR